MEANSRFQFKIFFGNVARRFSSVEAPTWEEFNKTFEGLFTSDFNTQSTYKFEYVDNEGDRVALDTDVEWAEMLELSRNTPLKKLYVSETKVNTVTPAQEKSEQKKMKEVTNEMDKINIREEVEKRAREVEIKEREEAEKKAEKRAREEAERKAREEAERKAHEEAERKAREEAEKKAREEAEKVAREESEKRAREILKAREEAEIVAREESEKRAREILKKIAREEAEKREREELEKARAVRLAVKLAKEEKAREKAEKKAREEAEKKARDEAEKKARDEAEKKARDEAEKKAREEAIQIPGSCSEDVVRKYKPQLETLYEMGFRNVSRNLLLLVKFSGKMDDVISTLLSDGEIKT